MLNPGQEMGDKAIKIKIYINLESELKMKINKIRPFFGEGLVLNDIMNIKHLAQGMTQSAQ